MSVKISRHDYGVWRAGQVRQINYVSKELRDSCLDLEREAWTLAKNVTLAFWASFHLHVESAVLQEDNLYNNLHHHFGCKTLFSCSYLPTILLDRIWRTLSENDFQSIPV